MAQTGLTGVLSSGSGESVDGAWSARFWSVDWTIRSTTGSGTGSTVATSLSNSVNRSPTAMRFSNSPVLGIGRQPSRDLFACSGGSVPSK